MSVRGVGMLSLLLINAALLGVTAAGSASSHDASTWYPKPWSITYVPYVIDPSVRLGMRPGMKAGLENYSNLAGGNGPNFVFGGEVNTDLDFDPCDVGPNAVFEMEDYTYALTGVHENGLAVTLGCTNSTDFLGFEQVFESTPTWGGGDTDWYQGTSAPPAGRWDLRSVATHEAGHATGFAGHFGNAADLCPSPRTASAHTMCSGSQSALGTIFLRTLEEHDLHTIGNAY